MGASVSVRASSPRSALLQLALAASVALVVGRGVVSFGHERGQVVGRRRVVARGGAL